MTAPSSAPEDFPGTLYDGDGTRLAGTGPEFSLETTQALPHKVLIRDRPGAEEVAVLERGDRLWLSGHLRRASRAACAAARGTG